MLEVLKHARRRLIFNVAFSNLVMTAAFAAGTFALLLIVGTRWLDGGLLAAISGGLLLGDIYRTRKTAPDLYTSAVELDRRAGLHDALSTALHFSSTNGGSSFREPQRLDAERRANEIDVPAAVPFVLPKSVYALAGLITLAGSLMAVRYGMLRTLDLHAPITEVFFEDQAAKKSGDKPKDDRDAQRHKRLEDAKSLLAKMGVPLSPEDASSTDAMDKAIDQALQPPGAGQTAKGQKSDEAGKGLNQAPGGDPMDDKVNDAKDNAADKDSPGKDSAGGDKGKSGDNAGLMSKLKDAVSNMLSKASNGDKAQQSQGKQQSQAGKSDKGKAEKGKSNKSQDSSDSADAQEGESDKEAQAAQEAAGKANAKSAPQNAQAGSGVGSQDGSKDLRAAEQLKAMGKISEIIGKRAATVSGETMVEVQSGNQQLRTEYSKTAAGHAESDGDVSRDQIPVSLQPYVRQYFEQVRKPVPAAKH